MTTLKNRVQALSPEQRRHIRTLLDQGKLRSASSGPQRGSPRSRCPLSPPQRRIWLLSQFQGATQPYNIPAAYMLRGELDTHAFRAALEAVARRHEILRTTFDVDAEGEPGQIIHASPSFDIEFHVDRVHATADTEALVGACANAAFDLQRGPLWRARLYRREGGAFLLALSFHHLVFDGWSSNLFAREVFAEYQRRLAGDTPPPMPALQYADYVAWQAQSFTQQRREQQGHFWRKTLAGELPVLELPADRSRTQRQSFRGALHKRVLPQRLFDALLALGREEAATGYAVFLTLFNTLLQRYTGVADLIVGTPVSGRIVAEIEPMIGMFVNTLPIRAQVPPHASFREVLRAVRQASLDAFAHQELPFEVIVEQVQPQRQPGVNPIFQVLYAYQNVFAPIDAGSLSIAAVDVDAGTAKFDLSLDIYESDEGAACVFEYSTDLFDAQRIERMAAHLERLAQSAVDRPDAPIAELDLLPAAEREQLCGAGTLEQAWPVNDFVAQFERRASAEPQQDAVREGEHSISYGALDRRANQLAHMLAARGVRRGQVVGICLPRGIEAIVAVLGAMKAGAAFVALDPALPPERLRFIAEDAAVAQVVSAAAQRSVAAGLNAPLLWIDDEAAALAGLDGAVAPAAPAAQDVAYVVYTSGTTGQPKGVCVTHGNWMNAYFGWERIYNLEALHAHLQMASFPFDVFCGDLARALCSGKTLVICPHELFAAPDRLHKLILDQHIDCAEFVPAVFRGFAEHLFATGKRLDGLRILIVASDSWYVEEYRSYRALCGEQTRLINSYGMAEAAIDSTWFEGDVADAPAGRLVPIGRPFPNVRVLVLDANLQVLPIGVVGEICVGGGGVARGYLNRDALNREKFIDDPFSLGGGGKLYRTGDYGRWLADGNLELVGRRDDQVKIRGLRIELGEIETALAKLPGVRRCAASVREDAPGHTRVVGYLVLEPDAARTEAERLKSQLAEVLPAYMVPSDFVVLDALPLSANGKVDRKRLPKPDGHDSAHAYVAPRTLAEERIAAIWSDVFQLPRIGIHDNFFELGGHSLMAFQIVARVRDAFCADLSLQSLFELPTVAQLGAAVGEGGTADGHDGETVEWLPAILPDPDNRYEPFPLTDVQQAYWLGRNEVFEFGNVSTHSYDELEIHGLDVARLERAWNKVVAQHEMLRAVVLPDGTQQILRQVPAYRIDVQDLRGLNADDIESGLQGVRDVLSHQILDLANWPVFDLRVSLLDGERMRVHLSTDAVMFDVWSFIILLEDWVRFYLDETRPVALPALSFRDYVLAERALQETPRYARALEYWRERVALMPPAPELPLARDPASLVQPRFTRLHGSLDPQLWTRLKRRAERAGLTPTGIALAAYAEAIAAYSASPAFSLNMTFLKRRPLHREVNEIVGEFTSLNLLGIELDPKASFLERARRIQADLWNDLEHHDVSGVQVLRELARQRGSVARAQMPVVFTSALVVPIPEQAPDFPVAPMYRDGITQTPQVWLDCGVWEAAGALLCNWDVVRELFPDGLLDEMFAGFWRLLHTLAQDDAPWQQSVPCPRALDTGPPRPAPPAATAAETLPSLFLASFARAPDALAVIAPDRALTYTDMAEHAAFVASAVREAAIGRNELVAVCMDKGWQQAATVLGISAAGAAYLPIDPSLPDERIALLLEQGRVRLVVTQPWRERQMSRLFSNQVACLGTDERLPYQHLYDMSLPEAEDLAYVIFTSGSTGRPKGVMIDHRGVVNTLRDINQRFAIGAEDRVLALSSLSFDLSVYDVFGSLAAGAAIVYPEHDRRLDPSHWEIVVKQHGVTVWNSVPALCSLLIDYAEHTQRSFPTLRQVMLSGDWIALTLPDRVRARCPNASVTSLGGATEASIWSIAYPINTVDRAWSSIPYGRALNGQSLYVLDERLEPRPHWASGEIYIGGTGLALGYWDDPEKTAAAFIPHPRSGERLYRTGDLGRRLPDGDIEFLGRNDFQVKVQGHRIELGEIEKTLLAHPAVAQAVADALGPRSGDKRLLAWVVMRPGGSVDTRTLQRFLDERLPEYMVPQQIAFLDALPLTANGKVDRRGLPQPHHTPHPAERTRIAPRDPLEHTLARVWCDILDMEQVGVHDDFFELGGDSMLAIKLLTALRAALPFDFQLKHIFRAPRIAALAELVCTPTAAESVSEPLTPEVPYVD